MVIRAHVVEPGHPTFHRIGASVIVEFSMIPVAAMIDASTQIYAQMTYGERSIAGVRNLTRSGVVRHA